MLKPGAEVVTFLSNAFVFQVKPSATQTLKRFSFKEKPKSTLSKYNIYLIDMFITEDKRIWLDKLY